MNTIAIFILGFLSIRTFISLVNLLSGLHLPVAKSVVFPKVSILIPARNEEASIGNLLNDLRQLNYPNFEVIVCNDHSSDNTEEILNCFAGDDDRIHWFLGEKLPQDWLGKNFACHQLAHKSSGKYLIFLDADVEIGKDSISRAVSFFQEKRLTLLTIFPQQKMETLAEQMIVPLMNWILQSLLPMLLVQKTKFSSIAAANGQFMMFDAANYRNYLWHSMVRNQNVEDIRLARMVKDSGFKMAVLLGNKDIYCRMYRQYEEAVLGFSRNVHEYFGGRSLVMFGFWLIVFFGPVIVWAVLGLKYLAAFFALVFANRFFVSLASRQIILRSVVLHPFQMLSFTAIVFYNIFRRLKKETTWKGRRIEL